MLACESDWNLYLNLIFRFKPYLYTFKSQSCIYHESFKVESLVVCWQKSLHNYYKVFGFHSWETFFKDRRTGNFKEAYFNVPGPECAIFPKRCVDWRNHLQKAHLEKLRWKLIFTSFYLDQELGLFLIIFTTEFWGFMS